MDLIQKALEREIELLKQISERDQLIAILRTESGIAREVIARYCPAELIESAHEWLESKGL